MRETFAEPCPVPSIPRLYSPHWDQGPNHHYVGGIAIPDALICRPFLTFSNCLLISSRLVFHAAFDHNGNRLSRQWVEFLHFLRGSKTTRAVEVAPPHGRFRHACRTRAVRLRGVGLARLPPGLQAGEKPALRPSELFTERFGSVGAPEKFVISIRPFVPIGNCFGCVVSPREAKLRGSPHRRLGFPQNFPKAVASPALSRYRSAAAVCPPSR